MFRAVVLRQRGLVSAAAAAAADVYDRSFIAAAAAASATARSQRWRRLLELAAKWAGFERV